MSPNTFRAFLADLRHCIRRYEDSYWKLGYQCADMGSNQRVCLVIRGGGFANLFRSCQAILQGHTSLVGQLQMRGNTLVTGGSDGSVRVWSLESMSPIHRLAAHDNSVTSLQFDDNRIVSGGSDGRVKIWSLKTGQLVRELSQPAEAVWRVAFEEEKAVIVANRSNRTVMEVSVA